MALNNQIIASLAANLVANAAGDITGANIANVTSNLQTFISNNGTAVKSVSIQSSTDAGFTGNYTLTLPINDGNSGQSLVTDGSGVLSWANVSTSNIVNGNSNVNVEANANVTISSAGNANIVVVTGTGANVTGTLNVSANANTGNLGTAALIATGNVAFTSSPNVALGAVGNVHITGGSANQYLQTDGTGNLSFQTLSTSSISNGNSNVDIPSANGNVNISAVGNANVLVVTGTGANITGTANVTGNIIGGNIVTTGQITSTKTGNSVTGNSQLYLNGSGNNRIEFNINGVNPPANTTRSSGTKITLYPAITSSNVDYAIGIDGSTIWTSLPNSNNNAFFKWYGGITEVANLSGIGDFTGANIKSNAGFIAVANNGTSLQQVTIQASTSASFTANYTLTLPVNDGAANQYLQTDGSGVLSWSTISTSGISNGNSNVSIPSANGNVNISAVGNTNVLVVTGTGANITGTANVTGNLSASNISTTGNFQSGNLATTGQITSNRGGNASTGGGQLFLNGAGNNRIDFNVDGANPPSNVTRSSGTKITLFPSLTSNKVDYAIGIDDSTLWYSVPEKISINYFKWYGGTVEIARLVANGDFLANNITTAANAAFILNGGLAGVRQVSIKASTNTSWEDPFTLTLPINTGSAGQYLQTDGTGVLSWQTVSTSGSFISNGNSNVSVAANGNVNITAVGNANILVVTGTGANVAGYVDVTGNFSAAGANVSLGAVGNLHITGGSSGQILTTDGAGNLSWGAISAGAAISNGNSNVNIPSANGNVNISAVGNANIVVVTGTGANITGTLDVTANANVGNLGTTTAIITTGNITTVNSGLVQNGNSNVTITANANVTITAKSNATMVISDTGANITGTANVTSDLSTGGNLTVSGTGVTSIAGNINMNGKWVGNIGYAVADTDAASKLYVDTLVSTGVSYHAPVNAATTTTLAVATGGTIAYNQPNGAGNGIGAFISTTGTFTTIDGVTINGSTSIRILVKDEANGAFNGVYNYTNATAITRTTDTDESGTGSTERLGINDYFFTQAGTVNLGTAFIVSSPAGTITFGTSNIQFSIFSSSQVYTGGTGITVSGTVISANANQSQVTTVGTLGNLDVTGNTTSGNFIGIFANGNSNVSIPAANGNVNISAVGNANVVTVTGANVILANAVPLTVTGNNGTNLRTVSVKATTDANFTANYSLILPANVGTAGQYLQTDGNNPANLAWASISGGSQLTNGTSNVVVALNSNISMGVGGSANILNLGSANSRFLGDVYFANSIYVNAAGGGGIVGNLTNGSDSNIAIAPAGNGQMTFVANANTMMTITGTAVSINGNGNINGGNIISSVRMIATGTGQTSNGGGQLYLNGGTLNRIDYNTAGGAAPSNTTRSAGTKITFYPAVDSTNVDYAVGIAAGALWHSVPGSGEIFKWYGGITEVANLTGDGTLTATILRTAVDGSLVAVANNGSANRQVSIKASTDAGFTGNYTLTLPINDGDSGQVLQTNGSGVLSWVAPGGSSASIANGNSNVNIPSANGNVNISAVGNANILVVTGTGANITGTANVTGNVVAGNLTTTGQITSNRAGNLSDGGGQLYLNGSGNNRIDFNTNGTGAPTFTTRSAGTKIALYPSLSGSAGDYALGVDAGTLWNSLPAADAGQFFKWYGGTTEVANLSGTGVFQVVGNANVGNLGTATAIITTGNITTVNTGLVQNGNSNIAITSNANITLTAKSNATMVISDTGANITGTANISGNANVGNLGTAALVATGGVNFTTSPNVSLGAVGNVKITGGTADYVLKTDGTGNLSWVAQAGGGGGASIANGNSNVNIATANGNVTISAVGNADILVVTGTGANVTGTANVTGNVIGGNIVTTGQITSTRAGNASTGGGQLYLNGSGNVRIDFSASGLNPPAFTTRSSGQKITLYPALTGSEVDYAIGVAAGAFWSSIDQASSSFDWFAGTTEIANLTGTGAFQTAGNITAPNFLGNLVGAFANGNSNISINANGNINMSIGGNVNKFVIDSSGNLYVAQYITGAGGIVLGSGNTNIRWNVNNQINFQAIGTNVMILTNTSIAPNANIIPASSNNFTLGNSSNYFANAFIDDLSSSFLDSENPLGFRNVPIVSVAANVANTVAADAGKAFYHASGAAVNTVNIAANANVSYINGTVLTFINLSANALTISCGDTMTFIANGATGSRTLANNGMATAIKVANTAWVITGSNIT